MQDDERDEESRQERDDVRCDSALQTMQDVLWRFNESNEGTLTAYDVIGFLVEDLVQSGFCAAYLRARRRIAPGPLGAIRILRGLHQ